MASRLSWPRVVAGLVIALGSALIMPAASAEAAPTKATTVSAGYTHTCDVRTNGAVRCWGYNAYGQLGDNSTTNSVKPVGVYGLGSKVKSVSPGYMHTCAVTTKGKVWCWGYNAYGQLGDNTTTNSAKPVAVAGLGKVKAVDAGYFHTCALTTKGAIKCWGYNGSGQLGDNSTTSSLAPVTVYGITKGARSVSAAYGNTCAIKAAGKAVCWGDNSSGQLGDNSTTSSPKPVAVYGLAKGVKQISAGIYNTCAVNGKNKALCWGYNGNGQLGDNSTSNSLKPVGVYGLGSGVKAVKTAVSHSCALTSTGKAKCWGNNDYGQLGDNSTTNSLKPVNVYNLDKSTKVSVGYLHTCVLTSKKAVKCWGYNGYGEIGDNTTTNRPAPVKVFGY